MIYLLDSIIHAMNNWALMDRKTCWLPCRVLLLTLIVRSKWEKQWNHRKTWHPLSGMKHFWEFSSAGWQFFCFTLYLKVTKYFSIYFKKILTIFLPCFTILIMLVQRILYQIKNNPLTGIFLYSHHLSVWYCFDDVGRNSVLVTHGG